MMTRLLFVSHSYRADAPKQKKLTYSIGTQDLVRQGLDTRHRRRHLRAMNEAQPTSYGKFGPWMKQARRSRQHSHGWQNWSKLWERESYGDCLTIPQIQDTTVSYMAMCD